MPNITLPDGSVRSYSEPVAVKTVVQDIGPGLAKAALAAELNGQLIDLSYLIEQDANLKIITAKDKTGLEIIRHSTAHLLAQAVKHLFPSAQVTIGPVIEDGFYYDFAFERSFTPEDLTQIENKMRELAKQNLTIEHKTMPRSEAIQFFEAQSENYKVQIIQDLPESETLGFYTQGEFTDLCRGPHVPSTGHLKAFKLMKLAGAYWRGDSNNEMLQRIYGTAWPDQKSLKAYLHRLEEAEKRDHRKLAKAMGLFHIQPEAPGMVFWHEQGWILYQIIEQYMRKRLVEHHYQEIKTPQLVDRVLWERSGHWDNYQEEMFITESEKHLFAVKPMSCPCHIQVYNQGIKSYRDLPVRLAEFGSCHRNEPSGTLHGLMRVRNFVQDDGHIFCREDQLQSEAADFIQLLLSIYKDFGFTEILVGLSTRPPKRIGDDALWDHAEQALSQAIEQTGLTWEEQPGDGAFYGPKIDFTLKDTLGRLWQCGTLQLDYALPDRLGAEYIAEDGSKQTPVMLHRAIFGSFERFIGVLLEHYAGHFPLWLAPTQASLMNITDKHRDYTLKIADFLTKQGLRVKSDLRNEKIGFKIREQTLKRVPYMLIIGDKEVDTQTISVRRFDGKDLGTMSQEDFVSFVRQHESDLITEGE